MSAVLNKLLLRQLKKHITDDSLLANPEVANLLQAISHSYNHYEDDHRLIERAIDLSSNELFESNATLRDQADKQQKTLAKLKESLASMELLNNDTHKKELDDQDILELADTLKNEIDQRKILDEELLKSESNISALIENTNDVIFSIDQNFKLTTFNEAFKLAFGRHTDVDIEMERLFTDVIHDEDQSFWKEHLDNALSGKQFNVEKSQKLRGHFEYYELSFNPIVNDKKVTGVSVFSRDVTAAKMVQDQLVKSENLYRLIFENNIMGMVSLDNQFTFTKANKAFCQMIGYDQEELIGNLSMPKLTVEEDIDKSKALIAQIVSGEVEHGQFEKKYNRKDKSILHANVFVFGVYDERGNFTNTTATIEDITVRKEQDTKRAELVDKLTKRNNELKDFAHIISHDLKAPLRAIGSLASWVYSDNEEILNEESKEQMNLLIGRIKRMYALIEGVLEYSKISYGEEQKVELDLNKIVKDEVFYLLNPPPHINIIIENDLPIVYGMKARAIQLFQNLISNAIKFIDKPNGIIKIGCTLKDDFWEFYVSDNGVGIDPKHHKRIFEIFQTLKSRDELENTGIGLTITKKIVELNGGEVWLTSKLNEGTTFHFTIPVTKGMKPNQTY